MAARRLAVSMDSELLARLDRSVKNKAFKSRSQAVQIAVREKLQRLERGRLARECAKLDPVAEQALADEGLSRGAEEWPEY